MSIYLGSRYFKTSEYLKDREIEYPLPDQFKENMKALLAKLDTVRFDWGKPLTISSGYRPGRFNKSAGGSRKSSHLSCEAADLVDKDGSLAKFCMEPGRLERWELYLENPARTPGWVHLQTRPTRTRIFNP
jgi:hypothetical protein